MDVSDMLARLVEAGRPLLRHYGLWAVCVGLFTETFMFTGLWVPGLAILIAAGYLMSAHELPVLPTVLLAWLGAILGDQISYLLGSRCGAWLLRRKKEQAETLRVALEREGVWLLFAYHHVSPLRVVLPCVAGSTRFNFRSWIVYDTLGVLLWTSLYLALGYFAQGTFNRQGNTLLQVLNGLVTILIFYIIWRVYSGLRRYRAEGRVQG